jgi:SAM-dependent methyltransferase
MREVPIATLIRELRSDDKRTENQVRHHYTVEKELAARLRNAPRANRTSLYGDTYDELYQRVPDHPQLMRPTDAVAAEKIVRDKMLLLRRFLAPEKTFLELGAGDCRLALRVAREVKKSYALEVSREVSKNLDAPSNFDLVYSAGTDVPIPNGSIHVAYSYQLMEHIHPEDAFEQLHSIYEVLAQSGIYVCITPNRLTGPHDVSRYFDREASGFHLREYTIGELHSLFRSVGFSETLAYVGIKGRYARVPIWLIKGLERGLDILPWRQRSVVTELPGIHHLLMAAVVAIK